MNFVGPYVCDRALMMVEGTDSRDGASVTVSWGSSATENSEWVMSGTFDAESGSFEYHDCVKTDYVYNDDGEVESKEEVYTGGHGFIIFGDDGTLTWQDDQEHVADDMTFTFDANAGA